MTFDPMWRSRAVDAAAVVAKVPDHGHVFIQGAAMTPTPLLEALCARRDFERVTVYHLHLEGPVPFAAPEHSPRIRSVSFFTGPALRGSVNRGEADFVPVFLKDVPHLFRRGIVELDACFVRLSPPDRHGLCTLGTSVDAALEATRRARLVLAVIDEKVPRTHGHTVVPFDRIDAFCLDDAGPHARAAAPRSKVEETIGEIIAALVEDGSTLQLGIGAIPDAVLSRLGHKRDLGVHTEMFSDGVVDLVEQGVITNRFKAIHAGRLATSFVMGSERLYRFVDDNPLVEMHPCDRTNDIELIRKNPRVVAVNSALAVDLSGQVQADSLGHQIYSGIGGQMDFIQGAALSEGGKPIIALPSTAKNGTLSRITPTLVEGAGVVTTRGHVHWVVTEHGAVNLFGQSLRRRGELLVSIAHPDFRPSLRQALAGLRHFTF
ncbi:MAG: acetyl-CoA hydrolase/transferase family protein [Myxococcales bacterium]|nr:acetyl-CoA hydrolase/transferase family protein [Myxococcales bacterium]